MTEEENTNNISLREEEEEDDNSFNEELVFDAQGENDIVDAENLEDFREKVRKSGVVYISHIPEGMTVAFLRTTFENYGVSRIYLAPENPNIKSGHSNKKRQNYKEGWVEFTSKLMAKLCEYELNGLPIGGKRNIPFREDLWTIKYLHKFKWHHFIEKMNLSRKLREQRMKTEIAQARREANFIEEKFGQSRMVNKKIKKREREEEEKKNKNIDDDEGVELDENEDKKPEINKTDIDDRFNQDKFKDFKRNFKQRQPIYKK